MYILIHLDVNIFMWKIHIGHDYEDDEGRGEKEVKRRLKYREKYYSLFLFFGVLRQHLYIKQLSGFGALHLRPNLLFRQTSDTCPSLSEIPGVISGKIFIIFLFNFN